MTDQTVSVSVLIRATAERVYSIIADYSEGHQRILPRPPFGDVTVELDLSPLAYLALSARNVYSVNSGGWRQSNYDLAVSDTRGDSAAIG